MSEYTVQYSVEYEGLVEEVFSSLEEVRAWVQTHKSNYDYDIGNVEVFRKQYEDIYELMKGHL